MKAEQKQTGKTDTVLWVLVLILVVFGLGALFSASEYNGRVRFHDSAYYFKKQLFATALGLLVMYLASKVDYRIPVKLAPGAYILSLFLSTAVLLFGQEINGSKRWLNLGPLSFQPSEFSKVAVILFLVWQISRTKSKTTGFWFMCRHHDDVASGSWSGRFQQLKYSGDHSRDWCAADLCGQSQIPAVSGSGECGNRIYCSFSCCGELPSGASGNLAGSGKI